jgi:Xaa-Pro aminopeptidase
VSVGVEETCRGWTPGGVTTRRRVQEGEPVLLELGVVADGYWSDRTRTVAAGRPGDRLAEVLHAVNAAQDRAILLARPGVPAAEVDAAARRVLREAGLDAEFLHGTGHGLGFRYHEPRPLIAPSSRDVLQEGMIHSVEPGAYSRAFGGVRTEDDVLIAEAGAAVLGPFDRSAGPTGA